MEALRKLGVTGMANSMTVREIVVKVVGASVAVGHRTARYRLGSLRSVVVSNAG
jgi:hypothetical protein